MSKAAKVSLLASIALGAAVSATPAQAHTTAHTHSQSAEDVAQCQGISAATLGATEAHAKWVAADAAKKLPAYCEVSGTLSPAAGSRIGVVYRLPAGWNGKLLGLGGGGWAGNVTIGSAVEGLQSGYATAQTDGGHAATDPWDTSWTTAPEAVTDFAYRAINRMTVSGKALVRAYYGRAQSRAYFQGCSTGGRMALMEAQRFPEDYDGIIAGAPVFSLQVQSSAVLRNNVFAGPGAAFTQAQLEFVNRSVLAACDGKDGAVDGVITQPRACAWQPVQLVCKPGKARASCLAPAQVTALNSLYAGIRAPDGAWAMLPLAKGGEAGWSRFINIAGTSTTQANGGGMPGLSHLLFGNRPVDFAKLDPAKDVPEARSSAFAHTYEATDADLSAFFARGGKLILWHGESDPGPASVATLAYAADVHKAAPQEAAKNLRTYLLPGVEHCRGGPGADDVNWLAALDHMVEGAAITHQAPASLIAFRQDEAFTRPVCLAPLVPQHDGKGDAHEATSWRCVPIAGK